MNQFQAIATQVFVETAKAGLEILNEVINPENYYDENDDYAFTSETATRGDEESVFSPIIVFIGSDFNAEDVKVRLRPERIEVEAEEFPLDVTGAKVRQFVQVPYGIEIVSVEYSKDEGFVRIFTTLPEASDDVMQEMKAKPATPAK